MNLFTYRCPNCGANLESAEKGGRFTCPYCGSIHEVQAETGAVSDVWNCPKCKKPNPVGTQFCGECGSGVAEACTDCQTLNHMLAKFCSKCGVNLEAAKLRMYEREVDAQRESAARAQRFQEEEVIRKKKAERSLLTFLMIFVVISVVCGIAATAGYIYVYHGKQAENQQKTQNVVIRGITSTAFIKNYTLEASSRLQSTQSVVQATEKVVSNLVVNASFNQNAQQEFTILLKVRNNNAFSSKVDIINLILKDDQGYTYPTSVWTAYKTVGYRGMINPGEEVEARFYFNQQPKPNATKFLLSFAANSTLAKNTYTLPLK